MVQEALPDLSPKSEKSTHSKSHQTSMRESQSEQNGASRLIEFPGSSRAVPEWRKQLSQRVREVQERKAREAAEELAAAQEAGLVSCALPSGQLELVPDLEQPVLNPIVSKALERLERARRGDQYGGSYAGVATAAALEADYEPEPVAAPEEVQPKPKLTVVQSIPASMAPPEPAEPQPEIFDAILDEPETVPAAATAERRPVRLLSEDDVALTYLDNCLLVPALVGDSRSDLPALSRRFFAGVLDLILIALMVSPAVGAVYYTGGHWRDPRVIELLAGVTAATMFAYMTMSIAFTGRTLAMRMLSMKTIDLRTGLIPTGAQSIGRALGFVFSFTFLGLGQAYALIDPDKRTVYDRLSNTIVVRV